MILKIIGKLIIFLKNPETYLPCFCFLFLLISLCLTFEEVMFSFGNMDILIRTYN